MKKKQQTDRLFSIGEAAKSLQITRRMILNYEAKGLLQSDVKNGTSGNRFYTADTLTRIRSIRRLQSLGLSLDEIKLYFEDKANLSSIISRLEAKRDELNLCIENLRERLNEDSNNKILEVTLPASALYVWRAETNSVAERMEHLRDFIPTATKQYGTDLSKRMFFTSYLIDDPKQTSYCFAIPFESSGENVEHWPEEKAICVFYHGDYDELPAVRDMLIAYAEEHGLRHKGTYRNIYLEGPAQHKSKENYITQVALPVY